MTSQTLIYELLLGVSKVNSLIPDWLVLKRQKKAQIIKNKAIRMFSFSIK